MSLFSKAAFLSERHCLAGAEEAVVVAVAALEVGTVTAWEVAAVVDAVTLEVGAVVAVVALAVVAFEVGAVVDAATLEAVALEVGVVVDAVEFLSPRVITFPLRSSDTAKNCDQ